MSSYRQLSLEERCSIARLHEAGQSIRQIAATLDRQPSTIARELKRNAGARVGYQPAYAQQQAQARRWTGSRLERDKTLRENVLDRLAMGWSPEQVSGRLAHEAGRKIISHETIYRFVYTQLKRTNDRLWRFYLPRAKYKRGWRTKGGWPRYADRPSIHDRPHSIATRQQAGHWEADAMLFSCPGQAILVAHERHSRLTIALQQSSLKADPVAAALVRMLGPMPAALRRSITFDNGTEFNRHQHIANQLGLSTFFCDPRAPWQKGGVENAIGRLRRSLPRKTDVDQLHQLKIDDILALYNHTPRKCLGFQTPAEAFLNPLHFKCESTPGSSPG
ncbi:MULTISPECIES: IS30 family transposase [unclassified Sphingobium]|uniref:IS30 family transposase n=1 Tax=unclassified Sphingobium TaxID=2611147 RepID=UPI0022259346|nr:MULTISPECIES: IS30 family transposase [unclassified Sphingobium]MCW2411178.1 IS30 family transposase [Sphingobium sp. B8D3D]MCW2411782.1 IS30 family transposase [Sphingobium sp. B8D3D]MCW2415921.1 IS30 family transposase [Sphingobium sp. B8D3A]MCW2416530.1 IS30 family transposase [Sphingobium sp. B8D3A]